MSRIFPQFPFRLGTTSYIIPADILPNVEYLADKVDDIELVLFESDEISNIPDAPMLENLKKIAGESDLTYTVHLPLDTYLGGEDETIRKASVEKCLRIIERMNVISPFSYVIHFHGDHAGDPPSEDMARWMANHRRSVTELLNYVEPRMLSVETIYYPFRLIEDIITDFNLSICLDVGHVILCGYSLDDYLSRYLDQARVIHLHGVNAGKDHVDISWIDQLILDKLMRALTSSPLDRVVTLEIFSEYDLNKSIEVLHDYMNFAKLATDHCSLATYLGGTSV